MSRVQVHPRKRKCVGNGKALNVAWLVDRQGGRTCTQGSATKPFTRFTFEDELKGGTMSEVRRDGHARWRDMAETG